MRGYIALILIACGTLLAQDVVHSQKSQDWKLSGFMPRPYVFLGPELMGGGYAPLAMEAGVGFRIEAEHLTLDANGTYDNGHKTYDGTQPNPKGHDRGLDGSLYYRLSSGWAFGGGYIWGQLSTTNYTKQGSRPKLGIYKDYLANSCQEDGCRHDFSMRIGVDYLTAGTDKENGSHGAAISLFIPSLHANRHLFYREVLGIYRFHDTVTDPTNTFLTREQVSNRSFDSFLELTVMYRF
jgi:hypothetical protein